MAASKRGRPRLARQRRPGETPHEEILDAAAELFTSGGYTGTSTRRIADSVGITQSALYHYFATKDDILDGLLTRTVAAAGLVARKIMAMPEDPSPRLYAIAWYDSFQLLTLRWNLGALFALPETHGAIFEQSRSGREYLRECYLDLATRVVADMTAHGSVDTDSTELTVHLPFYFVEITQQMRCDGHAVLATSTPEALAHSIAGASMRTLGHTGDLTQLRDKALALLADADATAAYASGGNRSPS